MTKKEIAEILKPYNEDIKRHMGALIEHSEATVNIVKQEFSGLNKRMDNFGLELAGVKKILDSHTVTLNSHGEALASHTETLNSHTEMIGQILVEVEEIKGELKHKVDYKDFLRKAS
ncbi:MAG: hypothetical protein AAB468_02285 [Patescibacteria group bacterium]